MRKRAKDKLLQWHPAFYAGMQVELADAKSVNYIKAEELTITFVCKQYPHIFAKHLKAERDMKITKVDLGIYYVEGDIFQIQLIVTSELSIENNLWLRSLTNDLRGKDIIDKLSKEYSKHKRKELYKSVMNVIVRANSEIFKEARDMCEALRELFQEEFEEHENIGLNKGLSRGIQSMIEACKSLGGTREVVQNMVIEKFEVSEIAAEEYMNMYW